MLVALMALLVRQAVVPTTRLMKYGVSDSGIHPVVHHVGATGVRSGTGLKYDTVLHQGEELLPNAAAAWHSISTGGGGSDVSKSFPASNWRSEMAAQCRQ